MKRIPWLLLLWSLPAHAYFNWLPPNAVLPTSQTCAGEIAVTPETVPANAAANAAYPTAAQLNAFWAQPNGDVTSYLPPADWAGVKGGYAFTVHNPSTDMIMRWAACKWGIDENAIRGQAWQESGWQQGESGDYNTGTIYCSTSQGLFSALWDGTGCWASHSIIQMRLVPNGLWTMYPQVINSTGFALDALGAELRGCINGDMKNFFSGSYKSAYEADLLGPDFSSLWANCQGEHFSGNYGDPAALNYENQLNTWEVTQPWLGL